MPESSSVEMVPPGSSSPEYFFLKLMLVPDFVYVASIFSSSILDSLDSLLATAPVFYTLVHFLYHI